MNPSDFKKLLILWWVLAIILIPVTIVSQRFLPEELQNFVYRDFDREPESFDWFIIGAAFGLFVATLAASIGLYRLRSWGRRLFLWVNIFSIAISPAFGPSVMSEWAALVCYVYSIVTGGILFVIYLPPTSVLFEIERSALPDGKDGGP